MIQRYETFGYSTRRFLVGSAALASLFFLPDTETRAQTTDSQPPVVAAGTVNFEDSGLNLQNPRLRFERPQEDTFRYRRGEEMPMYLQMHRPLSGFNYERPRLRSAHAPRRVDLEETSIFDTPVTRTTVQTDDDRLIVRIPLGE